MAPGRPRLSHPIRPLKDTWITLYRQDGRSPQQIKHKYQGFGFWPEALGAIGRAKGIQFIILERCRKAQNGKSFADNIRGQKDHYRPSIACAKIQEIAGVSEEYIYQIEYPWLTPYPLDQEIMPGKLERWRRDGLTAYMNGPTLAQAGIILIDLKLGTQEWDFFTKVPFPRITGWRKTADKEWQQMDWSKF